MEWPFQTTKFHKCGFSVFDYAVDHPKRMLTFWCLQSNQSIQLGSRSSSPANESNPLILFDKRQPTFAKSGSNTLPISRSMMCKVFFEAYLFYRLCCLLMLPRHPPQSITSPMDECHLRYTQRGNLSHLVIHDADTSP